MKRRERIGVVVVVAAVFAGVSTRVGESQGVVQPSHDPGSGTGQSAARSLHQWRSRQ